MGQFDVLRVRHKRVIRHTTGKQQTGNPERVLRAGGHVHRSARTKLVCVVFLILPESEKLHIMPERLL